MVSSRLRRVEEKDASRRIAIAFLGIVGVSVFLLLFGVKILIGFSLLVDKIRGGSAPTDQQQVIILPPVLDPLPEATGSATITISGKGDPKTKAIIFVNDMEYKRVPVETNGTFNVSNIDIDGNSITIYAKLIDDKNNMSSVSNTITTTADRTAPKLTIDKPEDNTTINDGTHKVTVTGITDEDMKVTINGRIVVVKSDGSFSYSMPLNDGENILKIISRDSAGNETTVERKVIYQP